MAMFGNLRDKFTRIFQGLTGTGRLTEAQVDESLREVRRALIDADVALPVLKRFLSAVREKAVGQDVLESFTPAQALIRVVRDELMALLGSEAAELSFQCKPPAVCMLVGLQGAGKTTTAGKLAGWMRSEHGKNVLLVSTDVYRPAAREQLRVLSEQLHIPYAHTAETTPLAIWNAAFEQARKTGADAIVLDTAGRLHVDTAMMEEIRQLHAAAAPIETLLVVDSMLGQDAAKVATAFQEAIPLTGIVLSKADGDARGGAALSMREMTGCPIKFVGTSEKLDGLEKFYPDRMASRILGMGDMLGLIEQAEKRMDKKQVEQSAAKAQKGQFDLSDMLLQLQQVNKMGGLERIMEQLPGMPQAAGAALPANLDERKLKRQIAIILSMTPKERRFHLHIKASHKKRIAAGSGTTIPEVNQLLKQFLQMQKMMQKMAKPHAMQKMMRAMQGMMNRKGF